MKLSLSFGVVLGTILLGAGCQAPASPVTNPSSIVVSSTPSFDLKNTYKNDQYGFSFNYPEAVAVFEQGPNDAEKSYEEKNMISGTVTPLLNSFIVQHKGGEKILSISVPNHKDFPVVKGSFAAGYYEWDMRLCGNEGFSKIISQEHLNWGNKEKGIKTPFQMLNVVSEDSLGGGKSYYVCISGQPDFNPLVFTYSEKNKSLAEEILNTLNLSFSATPAPSITPTFVPSLASSTFAREFFYPPFPVINTPTPLSSSLKLEAQLIANQDKKLRVQFLENGKVLDIPLLTLSVNLASESSPQVWTVYLSRDAIYVTEIGYKGITNHYYFDGKAWQTLNLHDKLKSLISTNYELPLSMRVSDKYLHVWEAEYAEMGSALGGEEAKRTTHQQFILDRKTLKVLWQGTFPKNSQP